MKTFISAALLIATVVLQGCNGGNDTGGSNLGRRGLSSHSSSGSNPSLLNLNGQWVGSLSVLGDMDPGGTSIRATVNQQGDAITIHTNLTSIGGNLSGTIDADGWIQLTDAFDGETWTTYFLKATGNRIQIADFLRPPSTAEPLPPMNLIDLRR